LTLLSRISRSLKVIRTDMYRSTNYDFLLAFHSNHWRISYRFRDKRRFQSKIANFPHHLYLSPPPKTFPLELDTGARDQKTIMMGLPARERSLRISSAVWIQYMNVTDGRTDGHWAKQRPRLRIASRGKKERCFLLKHTVEPMLACYDID